MASLISIGLTGLNTSQAALKTTGHNISNVKTEGYSRQQTVQSSQVGQFNGIAYVGTGTQLEDIRRVYSDYISGQLRTSTSLNSEAASYLTQANQLDSLLADSSTGISSVLTSFFSALQKASDTPTDTAARQLVLSSANTLAERFNSISTQMSDQRDYINRQLQGMASEVNELAASVANYNKSIQLARASGGGAEPNDLLDARDEAVRQLSGLVSVNVIAQQNGNYDLYIGSGQPLVSGDRAATLSVQPGNPDQQNSTLELTTNNQVKIDVTGVVSGGEIGGLLRYRSEMLTPAINELGRLSLVVSEQINQQFTQGLDLNGAFGQALFADLNAPERLTQRSQAALGNDNASGNLQISIGNSSALTTSDYEVVFSDGDNYSVRRLADGADMGSGNLNDDPPAQFDGFSLGLVAGEQVVAGDRFLVTPTRNAAADISIGLKDVRQMGFGGLLTASADVGNGGTATIGQPDFSAQVPVYDSTAQADLLNQVKAELPVKMVFAEVAGGVQGYTLYDRTGTSLGSGTIIPGQSNSISFAGSEFAFQVDLSGSPAAGDSFTVAFNADGYKDNRNLQSVVDLQQKATVGVSGEGTGARFSDAYANLVEDVGARTSRGKLDLTAAAAVLSQAVSNRESTSGVNLDEEAANLVQFQQYYNASAQVIKVAQSVFDSLLASL